MKKWSSQTPLALLAFMLLLASVLIPLHASSYHLRGDINAPAVVPGITGTEGIVIPIMLEINIPGNGSFAINGPIQVGISTFYSMKVAVDAVMLVLGIDPRTVNVEITISDATESIRGPSASGAVALLTYALLTSRENVSLASVSITGAIAPDTTLIPIGGLHEKIAASHGKIMIIPLANMGQLSEQEKKEVHAVASIRQAARLLGYTVPASTDFNLSIPLRVKNFFYNLSLTLVNKTKSLQNRLDLDTRIYVDKRLKEALEALEKGYEYAAASLAFTAYLDSLTYITKSELEGVHNVTMLKTIISAKIEKLRDNMALINSTLLDLDTMNDKSFWMLEVLATSYARLYSAHETLVEVETILKTLNETNIGDTIDKLATLVAYASARLETAKSWYMLAKEMSKEKSMIMPSTCIQEFSLYASRLLDDYRTYYHSLRTPQGVEPLFEYFIPREELSSMVLKAIRKELGTGYLYFLLLDTVSKLESIATGSETYFSDIKAMRIYTSERLYLINMLQSRAAISGYPSLVSTLYTQYSKILLSIKDYENADIVAGEAFSYAFIADMLSRSACLGPTELQKSPSQQLAQQEQREELYVILYTMVIALATLFLLITIYAFKLMKSLEAKVIS